MYCWQGEELIFTLLRLKVTFGSSTIAVIAGTQRPAECSSASAILPFPDGATAPLGLDEL